MSEFRTSGCRAAHCGYPPRRATDSGLAPGVPIFCCRRQIVRRGKKVMRAWKIACDDHKNAHLKTLTFGKYTHHPDRSRRAGEMRIVNHLTGHLTGQSIAMLWSDYRVGADLEAREFTRTGLKRVR